MGIVEIFAIFSGKLLANNFPSKILMIEGSLAEKLKKYNVVKMDGGPNYEEITVSYGDGSKENDIVDAVLIGVTTTSYTGLTPILPFTLLITDVTNNINNAYYDSTEPSRRKYSYFYEHEQYGNHKYTFSIYRGSWPYINLLKLA